MDEAGAVNDMGHVPKAHFFIRCKLFVFPYQCSHPLHGLVLLVYIELGQITGHGPFVLELRAQPCPSQTLISLPRI